MQRMPAYGPQPHTDRTTRRLPRVTDNPTQLTRRLKPEGASQGVVARRLVLLLSVVALLVGGVTYGYSQILPDWTQPAVDWQLSGTLASVSGLPSVALLSGTPEASSSPLSATTTELAGPSLALPALPLTTQNEGLTQSIKALLAQQSPGLVAHVFVVNLNDGQWVNIQGDTPVASASVIKLPLFLAYLQQLDAGLIQPNEPWLYEPLHQASGSGELQYKPPGGTYPSLDIATRMMQASDNTATNMVLDKLGGASAINRPIPLARKKWPKSCTPCLRPRR
jgi:beta-lactamase class A